MVKEFEGVLDLNTVRTRPPDKCRKLISATGIYYI